MKFTSIILVLIFSVACIKKKEDPIVKTGGTTDSGGSTSGGTGGGGTTARTWGYLFVTTAEVEGYYGFNNDGNPTTKKFDDLCMTEASSRNLTGKYRAVLGANAARSTTSKWILKASSEYRRTDGTTVIGTTSASGIFTFPLDNAISDTASEFWTGLNSNWTTAGSDNCDNFNSPIPTGVVGDASMTDQRAINSGMSVSCSQTKKVLCAEIIAETTTLSAQPTWRKTFISSAVSGGSPTNQDPATRLDGHCQTEANSKGIGHSGKTIYKAFFVANSDSYTKRLPCLTAYCGSGAGEANGWILEASRQYRREDGTTVIGTTNANRIFDFPLTNSFSSTSEQIWTGFTESWAMPTNNSLNTCSFFTSQDSGISTYVGDAGVTNEDAIYTTMATCNTSQKLLCVEQTRSQDVFYSYPGYDAAIIWQDFLVSDTAIKFQVEWNPADENICWYPPHHFHC